MQEDGVRWDAKQGCRYLLLVGIQWRCGLFLNANAEKRAVMTANMGIGAGCSSTLFNGDREDMIRRLKSRSTSSSALPVTSSESSADETD